MIAVTDFDLYGSKWNFLYGLARLQQRVGVFSFARYDPHFWGEGEEMKESERYKILEYRAVKVMLHEIGHMFGLKHCIYFSCLMQGSMHDEQAEKKPFFLCPVCFRKLQLNMSFPIIKRFKGLKDRCEEQKNKHLDKFKKWYENVATALELKGISEPEVVIMKPQPKPTPVKQPSIVKKKVPQKGDKKKAFKF